MERWTQEFSRVVEARAGRRPEIACARVEEAKQGERSAAGLLWWKQEPEAGETASLWIGAEENCWSALGSASKEGGDAKQSYLDMLKQAGEGGAEQNPPALETLELVEVRVTLAGDALPPLLAGVERAALSLQTAKLRAPVSASPMLSRLMDLQLPVTVLLGRAVLPIRDVLKIASGSLIELDRQIGDYVEVRVHGTVVARGEIVSVRGNYGVRIKEIISRQDRIALQDAVA